MYSYNSSVAFNYWVLTVGLHIWKFLWVSLSKLYGLAVDDLSGLLYSTSSCDYNN